MKSNKINIENYVLNLDRLKEFDLVKINMQYDPNDEKYINLTLREFYMASYDDQEMNTNSFNLLYYNGLIKNIRQEKIKKILKD